MRESPVQIQLVTALPDRTQGKRKGKRPSWLRGQRRAPWPVTARSFTDPNASEDRTRSPVSSAGRGLTPRRWQRSSLLSSYQNCLCSGRLRLTPSRSERTPGSKPPGLASGRTWPRRGAPTASVRRDGGGHAPSPGAQGSLPQRRMGHVAGGSGSPAAGRAGGMPPLQPGEVGRRRGRQGFGLRNPLELPGPCCEAFHGGTGHLRGKKTTLSARSQEGVQPLPCMPCVVQNPRHGSERKHVFSPLPFP